MKVIVAIDSFKGCMGSLELADVIEKGIKSVYQNPEIIKIPVADGGEGTVEAFIASARGEILRVECVDAVMRKITGYYGILPDKGIAVIEMAAAAGLPLIEPELRNPLNTTTYGVGLLIKDAITRGYRDFIVGVGGSATNDGGMGMLRALGYVFCDEYGHELQGRGSDLCEVRSISLNGVMKELSRCTFTVACDVDAVFHGRNGAAHVFAGQKGADAGQIEILDRGLKNFADVIKKHIGKDVSSVKGAGAAGGLGGAFYAFTDSILKSGIEILSETIGLREKIRGANFVITGEGRIDSQTATGKAPAGIARIAASMNVPVIALCGGLKDGYDNVHEIGITSCFSIVNRPMSLEEAMASDTAAKLLFEKTTEIFRLLKGVGIK